MIQTRPPASASAAPPPVGALLREWRQRRRLSQLALAAEADISQRHLSFLESGRAAPSRDMVLHLAEYLGIPLRERNALLVAAGFAPAYAERAMDAPGMAAARSVVERILKGHEPHPALAIDRHWTLVMHNAAVAPLLAGIDAELLAPPVNVLRLSLHPKGLAPRIRNIREWRAHVIARLVRQIDNSADATLMALLADLKSLPLPVNARPWTASAQTLPASIAVPLQLDTGDRVLSFLGTTTVFGTALDISLSELAIESFFPADAETAAAMRALVDTAL